MSAKPVKPLWLWLATTPRIGVFGSDVDERLLAGRTDGMPARELGLELDALGFSIIVRGVVVAVAELLVYAITAGLWNNDSLSFGLTVALVTWPLALGSLVSAARVLLRLGWAPGERRLEAALRLSPAFALGFAAVFAFVAVAGL